MYASVEMLLKFYAENFSSDSHSLSHTPNTRMGTHPVIFQDRRIRIGFRVTLHAALASIGFTSLRLIS
jgi:hypothetical protein